MITAQYFCQRLVWVRESQTVVFPFQEILAWSTAIGIDKIPVNDPALRSCLPGNTGTPGSPTAEIDNGLDNRGRSPKFLSFHCMCRP
jgi:hypothetical protein